MTVALAGRRMAHNPLAVAASAPDRDLLAALDALPQQIVMIDAAGRITHANRAWRKLMRGRDIDDARWLSMSYLEACRHLLHAPIHDTGQVAEPLARLLNGDTDAGAGEIEFEFEGERHRFEWRARALPDGGAVISHHDVTALRALDESRARFVRLADAGSDAILILDTSHRVLYANQVALDIAGAGSVEDQHTLAALVDPALFMIAATDGIWRGEITVRSRDGAEIPAVGVLRFHAVPGGTDHYSVVLHDISQEKCREEELHNRNVELELAYTRLQAAQDQLLQSEKMASIGQLAAGVAHEINNPIGYVHSNLGTLQDYTRSLLALIQAYERAQDDDPQQRSEALGEVEVLRRRIDFEYLVQDLPQLIAESREGIERVKKIVQDLKDFSHAGRGEEWVMSDVHRGLDSTLNIVWNELKYKADVVKNYGRLPPIECLPSQLNQVFMNILVNAAQAIPRRGTITIDTGGEGDYVWVSIADTGSGIPEAALARIFDPFFTTKPVGQGTGLGLSLSYGIVKKHGGRIEVESQPGVGTRFKIVLPVAQRRSGGDEEGAGVAR
jgi:signal transduction histidine kinase